MPLSLDPYLEALQSADLTPMRGRVVRVVGLLVESDGPRASVGDICQVIDQPGEPPLSVEVVGFKDGRLLSVPLGGTTGIRPGARIYCRGGQKTLPAGNALLG